MDRSMLRIIVLAGGVVMGLFLMGCVSQDLLPSAETSPNQPAPEHAPSFTQFSDIPVPASATMDLDRSLLLGSSESWTGRLIYQSTNNAAEIFNLYKEDMPKFGWSEMTVIRGLRSVMTYQRGHRVATIEIQGRTIQGSEVSITVSPNALSDSSVGK